MSRPRPFSPAKLVAGLIYADRAEAEKALAALVERYGPVDARSPELPFDTTSYYEAEMGPGLRRAFVAFERLVDPARLAGIKLETNAVEESLRLASGRPGRPVNVDPAVMTASALFVATGKDFAHRVPLRDGVYAHLELLFTRAGIRALDWTYPDFRKPEAEAWWTELRRANLDRLLESAGGRSRAKPGGNSSDESRGG